ncbi:hypothetical protein ACJX0J_022862, partial [Zea mays]
MFQCDFFMFFHRTVEEADILFYFLISCISNSYSFVFLYIGFLAINCLIDIFIDIHVGIVFVTAHFDYMTLHNKNFNIQDIHQINLFWMIVEARVWFRKKNSKYSIYISIHLIEVVNVKMLHMTNLFKKHTVRLSTESSDLSITNRLENNL